MTELRIEMLRAAGVDADDAAVWMRPLAAAATEFDINTDARLVPWLANLVHESAGFSRVTENLNYSAARLLEVFPCTPQRVWGFTPNEAHEFERNPQMIANRIYSNRNGNGNYESGDGWHYRGRGPIQLTGRANYRDSGERLGLPLEDSPDLVADPFIGARVAGDFWRNAGCNALADRKDFMAVRRAINGARALGAPEVVALIGRIQGAVA